MKIISTQGGAEVRKTMFPTELQLMVILREGNAECCPSHSQHHPGLLASGFSRIKSRSQPMAMHMEVSTVGRPDSSPIQQCSSSGDTPIGVHRNKSSGLWSSRPIAFGSARHSTAVQRREIAIAKPVGRAKQSEITSLPPHPFLVDAWRGQGLTGLRLKGQKRPPCWFVSTGLPSPIPLLRTR